jgi:hypothetical protein
MDTLSLFISTNLILTILIAVGSQIQTMNMRVELAIFGNEVEFVSSVYRTETMRQLLCFKSKFPNHFVFTLEHYLILLFLVKFI